MTRHCIEQRGAVVANLALRQAERRKPFMLVQQLCNGVSPTSSNPILTDVQERQAWARAEG